MFRARKKPDYEAGLSSFELGLVDVDQARRSRSRCKTIFLWVATVSIVSVVGVIRIVHGLDPGLDDALCSLEMPPKTHVAFLVDPSDPLSAIQLSTLKSTVRWQVNDLEVGGRISLLVLRPDEQGRMVETVFSRCKIRDGKDADPRIENRVKLEKRYLEAFEAPLRKAMAGLNAQTSANNSPILEALYEVVNHTSFSSGVQKRVLMIWSDMLQNSLEMNHFKSGYRFATLQKRKSIYVTDMQALAGAEVIVYRLENRYQHRQTGEHERFWQDYFEAAGVRLYKVKHL